MVIAVNLVVRVKMFKNKTMCIWFQRQQIQDIIVWRDRVKIIIKVIRLINLLIDLHQI